LEGINQIIEERECCMLSHAKLPKSFYRLAVKTVVGIINISPTIPLDSSILEGILSRKVSYNHPKVFCWRTFARIPTDKQAKLDLKTNECVYL